MSRPMRDLRRRIGDLQRRMLVFTAMNSTWCMLVLDHPVERIQARTADTYHADDGEDVLSRRGAGR